MYCLRWFLNLVKQRCNSTIDRLIIIVTIFACSNVTSSSLCTRQDEVSLYFKGSQQNINSLGNLKSFEVEDGSQFFLGCCHPDGGNRLKWTHSETGQDFIPTKDNDGRKYAFIDEKGRLNLLITKSNDQDSGEYVCAVKFGSARPQRVQLNVKTMNPKIRIRIDIQMFREGSRPVLNCPVLPHETVAGWMYYSENENIHIKSINDSVPDSIRLHDPKKLDRLELVKANQMPKAITCWVVSGQNSQQSISTIQIFWDFYRPPSLSIIPVREDGELYFIEGRPAKLVCNFSLVANSHSQKCSILHNGKEVPTNFNIHQAHLSCSISTIKFERKDRGNFTCVTSTVFKKHSVMFTVNESRRYEPELIIIPSITSPQLLSSSTALNKEIQLICRIAGNHLSVQFRKSALSISDGWEIIPRGSTSDGNFLKFVTTEEGMDAIYSIANAQVSDMRKYQCEVNNAAGKALEQGELLVRHSAQMRVFPEKAIFYMRPVTVVCLVTGYPLELNGNNVKLVPGNNHQTIKLLNEGFVDKFLGINRTYTIQMTTTNRGLSHSATCVYSENNVQIVSKKISFRQSQAPKRPEVKIHCVTHNSIIFLVKPQANHPDESEEKKIVSQYVYIELKQFDNEASPKLVKASQNIHLNKSQSKLPSVTVPVGNLLPNTSYSLEWVSGNKFNIFTTTIFKVKTKPLTKPKGIESLTLNINKENEEEVFVDVMLKSECSGLHPNVIDIVLRWFHPQDSSRNIKEKVFLIKRRSESEKFIRIPIAVRDRFKSIEVQAATRNEFGVSPWIEKLFMFKSSNMELRSVKNDSNCLFCSILSAILLLSALFINMRNYFAPLF